jgi:hypothetical protein
MATDALSIASEKEVTYWAARIASMADLGDARLESRLAITLESLARRPLDAIPQASGDKHQAKAIYRFFANERFDYKALARCVGAATAASCATAKTIYAVQDTTSFNFSNLKKSSGLGPVNDSTAARGLKAHSTIAVDPDGVVRGALDVSVWARPANGKRTAKDRKSRSIEEKESFKWIEGMHGARAAFARGCPAAERPRLVHVMDREGDVHEVFEEVADGEGFLVRCAQNRSVDGPIGKAHDAVAQAPCRGVMQLSVPARKGQPAREAKLEVRAVPVTLAPSKSGRQPVSLTLIEAREIDAPEGAKPILWRLWTNEPAETFEQIVARIRDYSLRWRVEEYHLTLKSGCAVEKLELTTAERLSKATVVYAAVAARIVALRDLGKLKPETPCTAVLTDLEWRLLICRFENRTPARDEKPPTVRQAMRWIGRLGGHLARKSDGLPGVRTLWRGWRDLSLLVVGNRLPPVYR